MCMSIGQGKGEAMKAWYFSQSSRRLRYGDNRRIKAGMSHRVKCIPILCTQGLHGSVKIMDALGYAPGNVVWRVRLSGDMVIGDDKVTATERKYLWGYNADKVLRHFARLCALDVIDLWDAPDIVRRYLKTGDEGIRDAAGDAAWDAARATARAAQNKRLTRMILGGKP